MQTTKIRAKAFSLKRIPLFQDQKNYFQIFFTRVECEKNALAQIIFTATKLALAAFYCITNYVSLVA